MLTTRQAPKPAAKKAAVGVEQKGLKQAAVQQANAEKDAVKAATATANQAGKNAAAEHRSGPSEEKTAGDKATKQQAAAQVRHGYGHSTSLPGWSLGFRLYLERDLASMLWKPPVASMPGLCPPGTGDLVASRPLNTFMNCHSSDRNDFPISIIRRSGPPRASTASSASSFPLSCCSWRSGCASRSGKQRCSWCYPGLFGRYTG